MAALKHFNEELLSLAEEQHCQLGACAQDTKMDSGSEAEGPELARQKKILS